MDNGYIKLHRAILDSQVFAHPIALKIWIWCLAKANFKDKFVLLKVGKGETTIKVKAGQFIFGRHKAEEELNIDGSAIYRWINKFASKEFEMVSLKVNNQYTLITINKWADYQDRQDDERTTNEQPMNNQCTTNEQPMNTTKNDKNVKNVIFIRPTISEISDYCKERQNKVKADRFFDFYESKGWLVGKTKMKDWRAAIRNWEANSKTDNSGPTKDEIKNVNSYWEK